MSKQPNPGWLKSPQALSFTPCGESGDHFMNDHAPNPPNPRVEPAMDLLMKQVNYLYDTGFFESVQVICTRPKADDGMRDVIFVGQGDPELRVKSALIYINESTHEE